MERAEDPRAVRALLVMASAVKQGGRADVRWSDAAFELVRSSNESTQAAAVTQLAALDYPRKVERVVADASSAHQNATVISAAAVAGWVPIAS